MKYPTISLKQFYPAKGAIYYVAIATVIFFTRGNNMLFSHMKISCFRAKAHLVFHWCLYNNVWYVTEGKQLMKPLKFLSIKQLFCKKRLHNVLIGSKIKT